MTPLHICIAENRREDEVGVKLLVLSLLRHEPEAILHLFVDGLGEGLKTWLSQFPNVCLEHLEVDPSLGWNVKPRVILKLLEAGISPLVWIDSDIILTAPIRHLVEDPDPETVIVTTEFFMIRNRGLAIRTRGWGLPVGRDLPFAINNCVLRLTDRHIGLVKEWQGLLNRPDYLAMQAAPWYERPFYMMGDQEAMAALLGSVAYAHLPLKVLRRAKDIAQCFRADGYSPTERLSNWRRLPPIIHGQGDKPWRASSRKHAYYQVSPYWYVARDYRDDLLPEERDWLDHRPWQAMLLHYLSLGHPSLAGFLPALHALVDKRLASAFKLVRGKLVRGGKA